MLPTDAVYTLLVFLLVAFSVIGWVLRRIDERLKILEGKCQEKGYGILSFEFSWSADKAKTIMDFWRKSGVEQDARMSLWLDFAFLMVYPLLFALASWTLAAGESGWLAQAGVCIGYFVLLCTPLDAAENVALLRMLDIGASDAMARFATLCAAIKFLLVGIAVLYVILGIARLLIS